MTPYIANSTSAKVKHKQSVVYNLFNFPYVFDGRNRYVWTSLYHWNMIQLISLYFSTVLSTSLHFLAIHSNTTPIDRGLSSYAIIKTMIRAQRNIYKTVDIYRTFLLDKTRPGFCFVFYSKKNIRCRFIFLCLVSCFMSKNLFLGWRRNISYFLHSQISSLRGDWIKNVFLKAFSSKFFQKVMEGGKT